MKKLDEFTIVERVVAPKPKFFKKMRKVGLVLVAAGGALLAAPVALPVVIVNIAGYLTVAGSVLTAISQVTVDENELKRQIRKAKGME